VKLEAVGALLEAATPNTISKILIPKVGPEIMSSSKSSNPETPLKFTIEVVARATEEVVLPTVAPFFFAVNVVVIPSSAALTTRNEMEFKLNSEPFEDFMMCEE
jgi:hypothetical protein